MIAAIFDFDGTLVENRIWRHHISHQWRHGVNRLRILLHLGMHYPLYPLVKLGLVEEGSFRRLWSERVSRVLRGLPVDSARSMFVEIASEDIYPTLKPQVLEKLTWHQAQGHLVIILSGALQPLVQECAALLGITHVAATLPLTSNGSYTGETKMPACIGPGKITTLKDYLRDRQLEVNWGSSYAYADSYSDVDILSLVGNPVAVMPDESLRRFAQESGWAILD